MNKKLIEIFPNIEVKNNFTFSLVSKLEFSKKINSVIITATSDNFVSLLDIEQVKNDVITKYKLNNLKVIYNYSGNKIILNNDHILTVLDIITKKAMYTKPIFENCNIIINDSVVITLEKPYSSFLEIKKINKYIADNIFIMYNINIDVKFIDKSNVIIEKPKSVKMDISVTKSEVKKDSKEYSKDNKNFNKYNKYDGGGNAKLKKNMPDYVVIGNDITSELTDRIDNINLDYDRFCIEGRICNLEFRKLKTGSNLLILDVTDLTSSVTCKSFLKEDNIDCITSKLKVNEYIKVLGVPKYDPYSKEVTVMINSIVLVDKPSEIMDNEEEKRVELHMHSQMSSMDGVSSAKDLVKKAVKWGHRAVAITDHGVVQAFPEMHQTISKIDGNLEDKTKVIYGLEGYFINDCTPNNVLDANTYCVFDLETTGLSGDKDKITEVAIIKLKNGVVIDEYTTFVNPLIPIPGKITEITGITDDMVKDSPTIDTVILDFINFTKGSILVAHNSKFDMSFIYKALKDYNLNIDNEVVDTLQIAKNIYNTKNHKLETLCEYLNISINGAHRAINDARATAKMFLKMLNKIDISKYVKMDTFTYCVFDIETTGFHAGIDKITEIAAVKLKDGVVIDEYTTFVNPEIPIPKNVQELTNITNKMVEDAPKIDIVIKEFLDFSKGCVLVAHNSAFDLSFITYAAKDNKLTVDNYAIDTLCVSREIYPFFENHKLETVSKSLNIPLEGAHRAINDARVTAKVFIKMCSDSSNINKYIYTVLDKDYKNIRYNHIIIIAKNYVGLKNLYKIVSYSHLHTYYKKPLITRSMLNRYREGLIIGSACERGEVFQAVLNKDDNIEDLINYYDYLEIQPLCNNEFYIKKEIVNSIDDLININKRIIDLGDKLNKLVVATTDAHYLNKEDEIYRRIIMVGQGYEEEDSSFYFRTTKEMKEEFSYLDSKKVHEIVVTNTNKIADMCEYMQPVPDGTYPPSIEGSDIQIESLSYERARQIYSDNLPEIVETRLKKELVPIIKHGFAVMYMIARKLVKKSNENGYLVGSRGSVGSSFVATMVGITEVNPLPPHYVCTKCKYSFFPETNISTGIDLEDMICPNCNIKMKKDGMDIPFETFLGFKGDKAPDIDLNFSSEYQAKAHEYTEELFGKSKTYKAGTIGTIAEKTAYGFVKKFYENKNKLVPMAEINRLSSGLTGIKRTTGQHPGGIIVVPDDKDIFDFCPIQKPADKLSSKSITTHFDFHSIHDNLLKLDILGHVDPTAIRMLQDLTLVDPLTIPLDEEKVMSLFTSTTALGVTPEQIDSPVGTFAVPEFGTKFVRDMLVETKPTSFGELVRISGLSHGTDVWLGNAEKLIKEGTATLKETICTRDDIMIYLIQKGMDSSLSFKIMESVRKGKGLTEEMEKAMNDSNIPQWYITSCKAIKYMFPKAHAAAYVTMAFRIAYYKVYFKKEFYATYLSTRAQNFLSDIMLKGKTVVKKAIKDYKEIDKPTATEKDIITVLEVLNEMYERDVNFLPVDIYLSDVNKFLVEDDGIRPPLVALTGFGQVEAEKLVTARKVSKFETVDEISIRAGIGKVALDILDKAGCLEGINKSSQLSFF